MSHMLPCSEFGQISIMSTLKMLLLLSCWTFTGVMAKDPSETHYRLKDSSVCLHVTGPPPTEGGHWTFNNTFLISHEKVNPKYKEEAYLLTGNLTLCIKNLSESDTGSYKVAYFDSEFTSRSETSHVIVQGMVPTPAMTVNTLHHSNVSSGFCNFTVNCSIQDYWLSSVCDRDRCRQSQKSFQTLNITIFSANGNVVCSGNNHVSTNNVSKSLPTMCSNKYTLNDDDDDEEEEMQNPLVAIIIAVAVFALGCVCFVLVKKYILKESTDHEATTSAAQFVQDGPLETQPQSGPRVSTSSSEAEPSYENVDATQLGSSGLRQEQDPWECQGVDTIYNVPRPVVSCLRSDSRNNTAGLKNMQDTLILDSVTTNEAWSPTDTETIYSVLQKT